MTVAIFAGVWYVLLLKGDGQMKKQIITGIAVIACVALCAAVWPQSAAVGKFPPSRLKPS
ncbi:hypothetical protein L9W92_03280 [Pelotomaculum terephthalicicum JT]|uniref:hypothetical protein n=1 Tax=Pelotomaculum terephthalicicum TaxID=206393 RepID=UPI0009CADCA6|nr:hypothetical protein [Pelotomaculum terephthalicicum]MCG9967077.1 hypothetical protein [Pelotomaculum terephthalicicum JT]OPX89264.1 MAG: hypothetical protein A4E54_01042 [Pelotomaculum sp. PtaB.Bin117]OPY63877.1 MAG: hypothetical protein A4E56_00227 [Pelotomaculum sp. PtaU1.Bin065]